MPSGARGVLCVGMGSGLPAAGQLTPVTVDDYFPVMVPPYVGQDTETPRLGALWGQTSNPLRFKVGAPLGGGGV